MRLLALALLFAAPATAAPVDSCAYLTGPNATMIVADVAAHGYAPGDVLRAVVQQDGQRLCVGQQTVDDAPNHAFSVWSEFDRLAPAIPLLPGARPGDGLTIEAVRSGEVVSARPVAAYEDDYVYVLTVDTAAADSLQALLAGALADAEALDSLLAARDAEIVSLQGVVASLSDEIDGLTAAAADREAEIAGLEDQIADLQSQLDSASTPEEVAALEAQIAEQQAELAELSTDLAESLDLGQSLSSVLRSILNRAE